MVKAYVQERQTERERERGLICGPKGRDTLLLRHVLGLLDRARHVRSEPKGGAQTSCNCVVRHLR